MPKLVSTEPIELILPSSSGDDIAKVTIVPLKAGDMLEVTDPDTASWDILVKGIKSWNFTDATGNVEPINYDTVKRLAPSDFNAIFEALGVKADPNSIVKKKSDTTPNRSEEQPAAS